ncbi:MAG: transglycosylase domain-containing protein [Porphyromonas sp.]|nr:transglycosylase domain-containing protein [Porphyromonas sp.]
MKSKIIKWLWMGFLGTGVLIVGLFFAIYMGWVGYMPPIEQLQNPVNRFASQVLSSDGEVIGSYATSGDNRIFTAYEDMSPHLINALVATEDVRYHEHSGIDFRGLGRAIVKTGIMQQKGAGGGSTITQQLAKLLYSKQAESKMARLFQKPIEWVIAVRLERFYTKEEILTMYLNQFDFLYNAVGIRSAAKTYFNKLPSELNIQEAAMLVGMCKNPSYYNPILHKSTSRPMERRNTVFEQMVKAGILSEYEADSLKSLPIQTHFTRTTHREGPAPYMRDYIRRIMMANKPKREDYASWQGEQYTVDSTAWEQDPLYGWCNKNFKADGSPYNIYTDGLKIYTSLNARMQAYAEEAMSEHLGTVLQPAFDREKAGSKSAPFSASLTTKQREEIIGRAMRQSERWRASKEEGMSEEEIIRSFDKKVPMNLWSWKGDKEVEMSPRDSILYVKGILRSGFMAMNPHNGHVLAYVGGINFNAFQYDMVSQGRRQVGSTIKPFLYSLSMIEGMSPCDVVPHAPPPYRGWSPRTDNAGRGSASIQWGLQHSDNWITAQLMYRTSTHTFLNLLRSYGLAGYIEEMPAMSLGTPDGSVSEMVSAYSTFVNKGIRVSPLLVTHIEDQLGNVVATFSPRMTEVLPQEAADKMLYMLQNVVQGGTARRLLRYNLPVPLGGKTGTTQNNSDSWFMGFTPDIVAGCWVGGEDRSVRFRSMAFGQGAAAALPVFGLFMKKVYGDPKLGYDTKAKFNLPEDFSPCSDANDSSGESYEQDFLEGIPSADPVAMPESGEEAE